MTSKPPSADGGSFAHRGYSILFSVFLVGSLIAAVGSVGTAAANSPGEAVFEIESVETNAPITAGETFETTIVVTNTGNQTDTKEVWFKLGPHLKDEARVELAPGETTTVELSWDSGENKHDTWELTAATPDDSVSRMVVIEEPESEESDESDESNAPEAADEPAEPDRSATDDAAFSIEPSDVSSLYTVDDSLPATVTVDGATVSTMPSKVEVLDALTARESGEGYDYTRATTELARNETVVLLVDIDSDESPEMAFVDRDGDGTPDPTRNQFHVLYPDLNWETWNDLVT